MAGDNIPEDLRYTKDHEWVRLEGDVATIGITDYAQDALTDVVYVELPDTGAKFDDHASLGVVESVKSVSDIFAPFAGEVVAANETLGDNPELLNDDPYGEGWYCKMKPDDLGVIADLLDAAAYRKFLTEG